MCCNHKNLDGSSSIIFPEKKIFLGRYPPIVKGFCTKCKKTIEVPIELYNKIQFNKIY